MILFYSLIASLCLMLFVWGIYLKTGHAGIIDVFWGLNIAMIGLINLTVRPLDVVTWFTAGLLVIWALRLSLYLWFTRIAQGKQEARYETLSQSWHQKSLGFLAQYALQGLLAWGIALPFYTLSFSQVSLSYLILCSLFIVMGIIGETIADLQLYYFKQVAKGQLCNIGLWRFSRHPNYFFECMVWLGFSILGASNGFGLLSFVAIVLLFCIMWFITIPLTEQQSLKSRPEAYRTYIKTTSRLIPWWSKA